MRPLFRILLFLILAAGVTLVIATKQPKFRASSMYSPQRNRPVQPKFRASSMYSPQSNRPVQPSGPNPCSYLPGPGQCKPPK